MAVSQELQLVKQQEATCSRRIKISEATEQQIKETADNSKSTTPGPTIWKGVGKMFLSTTVDEQVSELKKERTSYKEQISALDKKKTYLETTQTNLVNGLEAMTIKA